MTTNLRCSLASALLLLVFAATAAPAFGQSHEVPYKSLRDTARAHAVVAAFDHASFEAATVVYPRDEAGGTTNVRAGNYMLWKITHLFASDRRVERIALSAFHETCILKTSQYGNTVFCNLSATVAVTHAGQTRRFKFVGTRNVGRFVTPKHGEDWAVIYSGIAATIDDMVKRLAVQLRQIGAL
ncbi:MAG: hypothetical protein P8Z76_03660 [Alphaproteobacteria bacterium]